MATERHRLAVDMFVLGESVFFAILIMAYVLYHQQTAEHSGTLLDVGRTGVFSAFLFGSSATMWRVEANARRGRHRRMLLWLGVTILFGATFLGGQGWEYYGLIQQNVTIRHSLFGTTFFTLTGFHGAHVAIGLLILGIMAALGLGSSREVVRTKGIPAAAVYWHFVDAVWVFIFSIVYLWGALA